jgi:cell wall-associated NlpC family hydrolase
MSFQSIGTFLVRSRRARAAGALVLVAVVSAIVLLARHAEGDGQRARGALTGSAAGAIRDSEAAQSFPEPASSKRRKLAESPAQAAAGPSSEESTGPSPGAPSDAQVRRELRQLQRYEQRARAAGSVGPGRDGIAEAPIGAPGAVADLIAGGNAIATFPYRLGGGHGSFIDDAYDCSGSVSYALAAAGFVDTPLTSGDFEQWGASGRGRWVTVYANPGHVYMTIGGLRFDTSGRAGTRGSRWQTAQRSSRGFVPRHWPGL